MEEEVSEGLYQIFFVVVAEMCHPMASTDRVERESVSLFVVCLFVCR